MLPLNSVDLHSNLLDGLIIGYRAEPMWASRVSFISMQKTVRMCALQIALYSFWTQFSFVERECVPGFIADYLVLLYQELDSALLAAKTAMCFYHFFRHNTGIQSHACRS